MSRILPQTLFFSLYVNDLHVTGNNIGLNEEFKEEIIKVFEMTDLEYCNQPFYFMSHVNHRYKKMSDFGEMMTNLCKGT